MDVVAGKYFIAGVDRVTGKEPDVLLRDIGGQCVYRGDVVAQTAAFGLFDPCFVISVSVEDAKAELTEDMENIAKAMKLLQMDYLGGHGTRGSGRVSFEEIELQPFFCDNEMTNMLPELKKLFEDVESYELLPV